MQDVDEQAKALRQRMFKHRFDQWHPHHVGWESIEAHGKEFRGTGTEDFIKARLLEGCRVATGYYPTAVRGYHTYVVFWKPRKA